MCSTGANVLVIALQGYKSTHRKTNHLNLATGDTMYNNYIDIAIDFIAINRVNKMYSNFGVKKAGFCKYSHIYKHMHTSISPM